MGQPLSPGQRGDDQRRLMVTCLNNLLAVAEERVYFKDKLSRFLFVSAGWMAAYAPGWTAQDLAGRTDFDVFTYAHAAAALVDEKQVMATGRAVVGKMERETHKDRADTWVCTTKWPLRDDAGLIIGTFGITREVTAPGRD